jgi:hypothetical protein
MKNHLGCQNCVKNELKMLSVYDRTLSDRPQGARHHIYYV